MRCFTTSSPTDSRQSALSAQSAWLIAPPAPRPSVIASAPRPAAITPKKVDLVVDNVGGALFNQVIDIPPLVGFWAKFNLFAAVLQVNRGVAPFTIVALAVAMSAVSLYYYLQVLKRVFVMPAVDETPVKGTPATMSVLVLIALGVVVLGCLPGLLQSWMAGFYAAM